MGHGYASSGNLQQAGIDLVTSVPIGLVVIGIDIDGLLGQTNPQTAFFMVYSVLLDGVALDGQAVLGGQP